jgi:hypothetical protein
MLRSPKELERYTTSASDGDVGSVVDWGAGSFPGLPAAAAAPPPHPAGDPPGLTGPLPRKTRAVARKGRTSSP